MAQATSSTEPNRQSALEDRQGGDPLRGESTEPRYFNSLFGEILDWMLAPLLFLWPISIAVVYHVANNIASEPYHQTLTENVRAMSRLLRVNDGRVSFELPDAASELLRHDESDAVYFQVVGADRSLVAGDWEVPWIDPPADFRQGSVYLRDGEIQGEEVRIAYQFVGGPGAAPPTLVQVAETRSKRGGLADRIIAGLLLPQFAIIPLAVILVYLGLGRGIKPLYRLQRMIERRRPLTHPVPVDRWPAFGLAFASKYYRQHPELSKNSLFTQSGNEVSFCTIGDASTSEGVFWETLNAAGVLQVPLAVSVWDDGYGYPYPLNCRPLREAFQKL